MKTIPCDTCGNSQYSPIFQKSSPMGEVYSVVSCKSCGLVQIQPQPSLEELAKYYSNTYFTQRTDRGYENYYSSETRKEIQRVFSLNLRDLGYESWYETYKSSSKQNKLRSLDIGCAAGYFVDYMKTQGFDSMGIEVAKDPAKFAKETLGLNVVTEDFLSWDKNCKEKFDVISLWATIEHLNQPRKTLEKIFQHLQPGGILILSTCRYGLLAKWKGIHWRYLNVPEHLYYYSFGGIQKLFSEIGFLPKGSTTYGSGMTMKKNPSKSFLWKKKIADAMVKLTNQGDMMAFSCIKPLAL